MNQLIENPQPCHLPRQGYDQERGRYTLKDWQSWEGQWELMNGVAYDLTQAPSLEHQAIVTALSARIFPALDETNKKRTGQPQT